MKKLIALAALLLTASCGSPSSTPASSAPATASSTPTATSIMAEESSYAEIADVEGIASGTYIANRNQVYTIDKATKKVTCYDYESNYAKLKEKNGTLVFEASVKFIEYGAYGPAISFTENSKDHYIYVASTGKPAEKVIQKSNSSSITSTNALTPLPEYVEPTYGSYVSEAQQQNKATEEGSNLFDSEGNSIRETFYLFLDLTKTSAKLYVGDNDKAHREEPLHQVENYVLGFNSKGLSIKIPHTGGEFNCSLTVVAADSIEFNNSMERRGDYSCSGTFTLIQNS